MSAEIAFDLIGNGHRYRVLIDGAEVGYAEVDPIAADGLLIKHTEVVAAFEGRGIGSKLLVHILEDARRQGRGVIPICPYATAFVKRHPEYMEYVRDSYRAVLAR